jgi:magnesium transporter
MTEKAGEVERAAIHTTGDGKDITCVVFRDGKPTEPPTELDGISEILEEGGRVVWFDVVDPGPNDLALLQQEFGLHPLAVEDAVTAHQRPKIESYDDYWFLSVTGVTLRVGEIMFQEIDIFAGRNFLVTVRHSPVYPIKEIEERWAAHPEAMRSGAGFLLYTILDTVVDGYLPIVEVLEDRVEGLEDDLFSGKARDQVLLPEIFNLKRDGQRFRRVVTPMREVLTPLTRNDMTLFPEEVGLYFRDVYDHSVALNDHLDAVRDMMNSVLEMHLSIISNRQNEVAKQLTIIATIFLPLSFIVGFFGQNFGWLIGHIGGESTFDLLGIGVEILAVAATLAFFKVRGWF